MDEQPGSPSVRLVNALANDILDGRLQTGDRLPPHRELADALRIGVGTVTKAYGLLERRGLVRSVRGSGTFVALVQARRGPMIDLSRNVPPAVMTERTLSRTLTAVGRRLDSGLFNSYPPLAGHDEHRRLMARWFSGLGMDADPRYLVMTNGAHHAVSLAMSISCGSKGTLFTEVETYPGALSIARYQGTPVVGVTTDSEGIVPEELDRAIAAKGPTVAALYVTPTMQNPTTATMGRTRREEIVSVCRQRNVVIIEDDVYTLSDDPARPPLAMLAPERTFYANSLSKTLNPTLRIGGLVAPPMMIEKTNAALEATAILVSPLSCAFIEQWLSDGTADAVRLAIRAEAERRSDLAQAILGDLVTKHRHPGYHAWLPMAANECRRIEDAAKALGVLVTPAAATSCDPERRVSGLRLCLGSPSLGDLTAALGAIKRICRPTGAVGGLDSPGIP